MERLQSTQHTQGGLHEPVLPNIYPAALGFLCHVLHLAPWPATCGLTHAQPPATCAEAIERLQLCARPARLSRASPRMDIISLHPGRDPHGT